MTLCASDNIEATNVGNLTLNVEVLLGLVATSTSIVGVKGPAVSLWRNKLRLTELEYPVDNA